MEKEKKIETNSRNDLFYNQRVETVGLPLRISNILRRNHIDTVGEMLKHGPEQLLYLPGFGKTSLATVEKWMTEWGLRWERE